MLLERITSRVHYLTVNANRDEEKLQKDFLYYLPWVGEDLWKNRYMIKSLQHILDSTDSEYAFSEDKEFDIREMLLTTIEMLTEHCMRAYNVRTASSSTLHTETSTWKFQCDLELVEFMKSLIKSNTK